ncbi:MAG: hypothetical protein HC858_00885 [Brachymonas sp.]|nr:hypothetical protein [Brachymonas sp.]
MLYGRLEEAQIHVIKRLVSESSFDAALSLKERTRRQQELIERLQLLAASKASPTAAQQSLREYITRVWSSPDPAYRAYVEKLTQQGCQGFASIHNSTTSSQRTNAVKVLTGYETDVRTLANAR